MYGFETILRVWRAAAAPQSLPAKRRADILFPHEWLIITVIYTQICPSKIIEHT